MHRLHHRILALAAPAAIALSADEKPVVPRIELMETKVISRQPPYYLGWPMTPLRTNGDRAESRTCADSELRIVSPRAGLPPSSGPVAAARAALSRSGAFTRPSPESRRRRMDH